MRFWKTIKPAVETAEHLHFGGVLLDLLFDWRVWLSGAGGGVVTLFTAAYDGRSVTDVLLAAALGIGIFAGSAAGVLALWRNIKLRRQSAGSISTQGDSATEITGTTSQRVKIVIRAGDRFEIVQPSGVNRTRTVSVKIENNTDNEISDGRLDILNLDPPAHGHEKLLLKGEIRLSARKHTFIPVAHYNEGTSQAKVGTWIRLAIPIAPVFGGGPGNLPVQPHTFLLKFSSPESGLFDEIACRLSVDANHVLHLDDWANSATHRAPQIEPPISLFEAATRAYEQTRDSEASLFAVETAKSNDETLTWYCRAMTIPHNGKPTLITLKGNQPPSRIIEPIEMRLFNRYDFEVENGAIILKERHGNLRFENLSVDPADLAGAIKEMRTWGV
jgi:hypothetical protein